MATCMLFCVTTICILMFLWNAELDLWLSFLIILVNTRLFSQADYIQTGISYILQLRVNFINMFTSRFYTHRSPKAQKAAWLDYLFALLGSEHFKAACKMLVKLTPGVRDRHETHTGFDESYLVDTLSLQIYFAIFQYR